MRPRIANTLAFERHRKAYYIIITCMSAREDAASAGQAAGDAALMEEALMEARAALDEGDWQTPHVSAQNHAARSGEVPIGCVVTRCGVIVARGRNATNARCASVCCSGVRCCGLRCAGVTQSSSLNATRHAEMEAINRLTR